MIQAEPFVRQRLTSLLAEPDAWGPPIAVELQLLLLVELLHTVRSSDPDVVAARYERHLAARVPGAPAPLADRLGLTGSATPEFVDILRVFAATELATLSRQALVDVPHRAPLRDASGSPHYAPEG